MSREGRAGEGHAAPARDVVFIRPRLLGDIVFTIPSIELWRRHFPRDRIHYVVEERFRELAELIPGLHAVIPVPGKPGAGDILNFRRRLRALPAELVVDFHSGPTSALLTRASGATVRIGYRTPNRNWAYTCLVPRQVPGAPPGHSVANQARLLEPVGIRPDGLPDYPALSAAAWPMPAGLPRPSEWKRTVILHVGAGNRFRDWGEDHFRDLAARLLAGGLSVALIGQAPAEVQRGARLTSALPELIDWTGRLGIRSMLAGIARAAAYVGADSGPLHLASLTSTPLVALYGPNLTSVSGPWRSRGVTIVQLEMTCRPCSQRRCRHDTIACMHDIPVASVHEAVVRHIR